MGWVFKEKNKHTHTTWFWGLLRFNKEQRALLPDRVTSVTIPSLSLRKRGRVTIWERAR